jgi:hypothetical protein
MSKLTTLFLADFRQANVWFKKHTFAKLLVFLTSLLILIGLLNVLFWGSYSYFWSIKLLEPYGKLTASYVLHSGLIITTWFVFLSSFVHIFQSIVKPSQEILYLMEQPIKPIILSNWIAFRTWIINSSLMLIFWLPVSFAFNSVFGSFSRAGLIINTILITLLITAVIQVVSTFISLIVTPLLKGYETWLASAGVIGFLLTTWGIISLVFPPTMRELLRIDIDQFDQIFFNLPLNKDWVMTGNIIKYLETGIANYLLIPALLALIVIGIGIIANSLLITKSWQRVLAKNHHKSPLTIPTQWWYKYPHQAKELLILIRDNSERNALFFFIGLLGFFFFFLQRSLKINLELNNNIESLTAFSLGAILFISTAFLLRIVFPLLTKEGRSAWYLLRESKTNLAVYKAKASFAKFFIALLFSIVNLSWLMMPLPAEIKQSLILYSSIGVILLGWLNTAMGLMVTEWEKGDEPEQISTSGVGILTLLLSLVIIFSLVLSYLGNISSDWNTSLFIISLGIILAIHRLSEFRSKNYQYPQSWE